MLGRTVVAADGEEIGEVEDVILDGTSGQARQIVVKSGGLLGMGGKSIAVDFTDAQMDPEGEQVQLTTLTAAQVQERRCTDYDGSGRKRCPLPVTAHNPIAALQRA